MGGKPPRCHVQGRRQHQNVGVGRLLQVLRLYHVAGANDYLVHVGVADSDALRDFAMNALTTRPEVAHLETGLIFSCVEPGEC